MKDDEGEPSVRVPWIDVVNQMIRLLGPLDLAGRQHVLREVARIHKIPLTAKMKRQLWANNRG